jgi:transposase
MVVTAGNINDTTMLELVLDGIVVPRNGRPGRPRKRPDRVLADKGYSSRKNRSLLRGRGIPHTIPEPKDQKANRARRGSQGGRPVGFDWDIYKHRNTAERCFNRLKQWRGLAMRTTSTPTTTKPDSCSHPSSCGRPHDPRDRP